MGGPSLGFIIALAWTSVGAPAGSPPAEKSAGPGADDERARGARDLEWEETPTDDVALETPPRLAGAYVGGMLTLGITSARLDDLDSTSGSPGAAISGVTMSLDAGTVVLPWMSIGFSLLGGGGKRAAGTGRQLSHGGLLADIAFFPKPSLPLSLRAGFGAGFGTVQEIESDPTTGAAPSSQGFGGAMFRLGARYAFFPNAKRRRPRRAGGWALAPELSWLAHPPAERGGAMANTILVGLWSGFFFGN